VITDFASGTDKLEISLYEFGLAEGQDIGLEVGVDPAAQGTGAQFLFDTASGRLWFDSDGTSENESPVLIATLDNVTKVTVADFVIVA
jgi:Ca2+-binding RTX toxin-like protein